MPAIPLPFVVSGLLLLVLLRLFLRRSREVWFLIFIAACAVQTLLVGLRWSLGFREVHLVQPLLASVLPLIALTAFLSLRGQVPSPWHLLWPPAVVLSRWLWPGAVDVLLIVEFIAYGIAILWRLHVRQQLQKDHILYRILPALGVALVLATPVAVADKLRFDIRPQKDHMRMVGQELARTLPEGARLAVIDPRGVGLTDQIISYELTSGPGAGRDLSLIYKFNVIKISHEELRAKLANNSVTHAWVHQPLTEVQEALDIELKSRNSHLLSYADGKWKLLRSWPYDGYDDPYSLPD